MTLGLEERKQLLKYNIEKANNIENDIPFYIKNNKLFVAVNRIYYGIFYMLSALALKERFSTSKHIQLIGWFNKKYVKEGLVSQKYSKIIRKAFENRSKSDYDVLIKFTKEEVKILFKEMKEVINEIKKLLT